MHDPTKFKLGSTGSSAKEITAHDSDPATFLAGLFVSMDSNGALSLLKSAGSRIGVSLGRSLSNTKKTAVARSGERLAVLLDLKRATGVATITTFANLTSGTPDTVTVGATVFTAQAGAATPGTGTFQAASSNNATATSLAAQINAHATASTLVSASANGAVVTLTAKAAGVAGNTVALSYVDNGSAGLTLSGLSGGNLSGGSDVPGDIGFAVIGAKVTVNDTTGKADVTGTVSDAIYVSGVLSGVGEDGVEVPCALIDMPGGF